MADADRIDQLKKTWLLDLVVENGSFQKAALQAKVTRSAVSQTISQLEKVHGKILLIRDRGAIRATPYCLEILERARPVLGLLDQLEPRKERAAAPVMSWLDIGAYESLAIEIIPRLLKRVSLHSPNIRVTVRVARSATLASMVRKGELCMAVLVDNDALGGLDVVAVAEDRLGLYTSATLSRRPGARRVAADLPLGSLAAGPDGMPRYLTRFLKALGISEPPTLASESFEALLEATAQGAVRAILPTRVARRRRKELIEITPSDLVASHSGRHRICMVNRRNCDPEENAFLAHEIRALLQT